MVLTLALFIIPKPSYTVDMADPVWGTLPKAQDNPQTIDEAIAAAIAAHEADPTAHMGAGESIDVHRKQDIIDHPAGSIVGDKTQSESYNLVFDFINLASFTVVGETEIDGWPGVQLRTTSSINNESYIATTGSNNPGPLDYTKDFIVDFDFCMYEEGDGDFTLGVGAVSSNQMSVGVWLFSTTSSTVIKWKKQGDLQTSSAITVSRAEWHTLRFQYSSVNRQLYVFLDGALVVTFDDPNTNYNSPGADSLFRIKNHNSDGTTLGLRSMRWSTWTP